MLWDVNPRAARRRWAALLAEPPLEARATLSRDDIRSVCAGGALASASAAASRPRIICFLSSTFTDTATERNLLIADVYPFLSTLARRVGVEFAWPSEMRWGIRSSASDEHSTSAICVHEILRCQRQSAGIAYVLLAGDKFGFERVPAVIPSGEFAALRAHTADPSDRGLLDEWYEQDENAVPPVHVMRRVNAALQRDFWAAHYPLLRQLLRASADAALEDEARRQYYFQSVTEEEIEVGLLALPPEARSRRAFVFHRRFTNLEQYENLADPSKAPIDTLRKFVDMTPEGVLDHSARTRLLETVHRKVLEAIPETSVARYAIPLLVDRDGGGDNETEEDDGLDAAAHEAYLRSFTDDFCSVISSSIMHAASSAAVAPTPALGRVFAEAQTHNSSAQARSDVFIETDASSSALGRVLAYLADDQDEAPRPAFALAGPSGSGKTTFMAHVMMQPAPTEAVKPVVIRRFCGTTADASSGRALLESVCAQTAEAYGEDDGAYSGPSDLASLAKRFAGLMSKASASRPLFVFLDALDQLSNDDNEHGLAWLPLRQLPPFVRLVVSTLPSEDGRGIPCLDAVRAAIPQGNLAQLSPTGRADGERLVRGWLAQVGRTVSDEQLALLLQTATRSRAASATTPLYFSMLANEARRWKSGDDLHSLKVPESVEAAIDVLYSRAEKYHGKLLVHRALGYLSVSRGGVSLNELIDLLSLDDEVLDDVFEWWTPPVRRLPPLLLTRLQDDLAGYVVERGHSDGTPVLAFFHRQFAEVAAKRFVGADEAVARKLHGRIASYYDDEALIDVKEARLVTAQPLYLDGASMVNTRKTHMLAHHLHAAGNLDRLREVLSDVDFVVGALQADAGAALYQILRFWREDLGGYDSAVAAYQGSVDAAETETAVRLRALGTVFRAMGRYELAAAALRAVLDKETSAETEVELAEVLSLKSDYKAAEPLFRSARERFGDSVRAEEAAVSLAEMLVHLGRYSEARELFETALARTEARMGDDALEVAAVCDKYGGLLRTESRFDPDAPPSEELTIELFERARRIRLRRLGAGSLEYAQACFGLARFYQQLQRFSEAGELFELVHQVKQAALGADHPDVHQVVYNQAMLAMNLGDRARSEELFDSAISGWRVSLGNGHPFVATGLQAKSKLMLQLDRKDAAIECLRECLAVREAKFGTEHPRYLDAKKQLEALL